MGRSPSPNFIMKYMTKTEWVLSDTNFMTFSEEAAKQVTIAIEKSGSPLSSKMVWNIVNKRIKRKLKNPTAIKGICTCDTDLLCEHRKKYLMEALDGEKKG